MKQFYFISGLPRSGMGLLSRILSQNPNIHSESSPLYNFSTNVTKAKPESCSSLIKKQIIRRIFDTYTSQYNESIIFDTNQNWTLQLPLLKELFPYTKIIVCVRTLHEILDDYERTIRQDPFSNSQDSSVYTRFSKLFGENGKLKNAYNGVKQAITSREHDMVYILEYEKLVRFPEPTIHEIYNFIGQPYFEHDLTFLKYDATRITVVPPDIMIQLQNTEVWRH